MRFAMRVVRWAAIFVLVLLAATPTVLKVAGFTVGQVETASMAPEIPIGSLVLSKDLPYAVGDIVWAQVPDGEPFVHRVISIDDDVLVTRGDANRTQDSPITTDLVVGKVVHTIPAGEALLKVYSWPGQVTAFIAALLLLWPWGGRSGGDAITDKKEKVAV